MAFNIPRNHIEDQADHIYSEFSNNVLSNLRWLTGKENANNINTQKTFSKYYYSKFKKII